MQTSRRCLLYCRGVTPYLAALNWQKSLARDRIENPDLDDVLLLLEHPPVYTLGRGADLRFLHFDPDRSEYEVHRIDRGGEVTYHCPGQLVGYPILNLRRHQPDLHQYLRQIETVLLRVVRGYGLPAERLPGATGVWVEGYKVAAIGIHAKRWISTHGFSLNVCPDLTGFQRIVPCGIADKPVGSLERFVPNIDFHVVRQQIATSFATIFQVRLTDGDRIGLDLSLSAHDEGGVKG